MRSIRSWTGVLATSAAVTAVAAAPAAAQTEGGKGHALDSGNRVLTYDLGDPGAATAKPITGIAAGNSIVGIDDRPRTGDLYAVTKDGAGNGHAYVVDPVTGAATLAFDLVGSVSMQPQPLTGSAFGVDFNPAADALRITGDDGQNLRVIPSATALNGTPRAAAGTTLTDGLLSYAPITASPRPPATGISESAYTNSLPAPASTQLFNIDAPNSDVTLQNPPNDGTQTKVADLTVDGRAFRGFDILSRGGATIQNVAYVATADARVAVAPRNPVEQLLQLLGLQQPRTELRTRLSTLDLTSGAQTTIGTFVNPHIVDIAVDTPAP